MVIYSRVTDYPAGEPVTTAEAKSHLRLDGDQENASITILITAARRLCEGYAGLSFVTQERQIKLDAFPDGEIIVPYGPVQSIDSVAYIDGDGNPQTLDIDDDYTEDTSGELARISPVDSWPATDDVLGAVTITYTAGYDDASGIPIPGEAKQAILMTLASLYENRQDEIVSNIVTATTGLSWNSKALLDNIKVYWNANAD